jgi:hypothetical protein
MPSSTAGRSRLFLFLPFAAVAVLAAAWSGFWLFAAYKADAVITAWLEQEAKAGRNYSCGTRTSGGYPFRIEVRCTEPTLELANVLPVRTLRARELKGVAQVYEPGLIIAEITGPLAISEAGQPVIWRADWSLAQASLRGVAGRPERLSVALDGAKLDVVDGGTADTLATAGHFELHLRRHPGSTPEKPVVDFAAQLAGATAPRAPVLGGRPLDAEVTALLRGLNDLRPKPMPERLKEWQAAGGRLEVTKLRLQQGEAVAVASGDIGLSPAGRPEGAFNITMTGFERLVQQLTGGASGGGLQLGLMAGLSFLGRPAEIDGKRAIALPLRFNDGAVSLGPLRLGKIEPLY